jgi:hypothetical protein
MRLPGNTTPEAEAALIACLRVFAARGRQLRQAREQADKAKLALPVGEPAASLAETTGANPVLGVATDATQ